MIYHIGTEMGTYMFQSVMLYMGPVHCGICEIVLLVLVYSQTPEYEILFPAAPAGPPL